MINPELFGTREVLAYEDVYATMKVFDEFVAVYIPKERIQKLRAGFEMSDAIKPEPRYKDPNMVQETNIERSLRRSRQAIKEYVLCNDFSLFVTFTIAQDRYDAEKSKRKLFYWLKNEGARKGKFDYLVVPEFHKDRKALHFHALLNHYPGEVVPAINPRNGRQLIKKGKKQFNIASFGSGHSNAIYTDGSLGSKTKTAWYLQKYITKDMPQFDGKKRYWQSRNLKRPLRVDNPEPFYRFVDPDKTLFHENGTLLYFDRNKHPLMDIYLEGLLHESE